MKKTAKKLVASVLASAMITAAFSGCSSGSGSGGSSTSSAADNTPVTINFWTISLQPTFTDYFNDLNSQYEKEHTNVTIKWTDLPYDSIQQKLITAIAGGTAPDVVNLNTQMALSLAGKNALVDLNKEATTEQKSIYIESLYNSAKIGDSVYAFPWYNAPNVLVYNKELFQKAGITKIPTTFDEALEDAPIMKEKTGAYLFTPDEFAYILYFDNISILDSTNKKAAFNTPEALAILKKYKAAVDAGTVPKTGWGSWDTELKNFETSKLAIVDATGQTVSRVKDEAPDVYKNIAVAPTMTESSGYSLNALMNIVVTSKSKNHTQAIDYAYYITNDDNQLSFSKKAATFPSTTKAAADSFFVSDKSTLDGLVNYYSSLALPKSKDFSLNTEKLSDIQNEIDKIYEAVMQSNTDPQTALDNAEKKVNNLLSGS